VNYGSYSNLRVKKNIVVCLELRWRL